jgi:hypothetical protein
MRNDTDDGTDWSAFSKYINVAPTSEKEFSGIALLETCLRRRLAKKEAHTDIN